MGSTSALRESPFDGSSDHYPAIQVDFRDGAIREHLPATNLLEMRPVG